MTTAAIDQVLARSAPTVFINACRSAGLNATYNRLDGWASKFLEAGAAAFIGSLWAVSDGAAREFAQELYGQLQAGSSLGEAVMQARQVAASQPDDPTWLAYTVYGDPRATVSQRGHDSAHKEDAMKVTDEGVPVDTLISVVKDSIKQAGVSRTSQTRDLQVASVQLILDVVASKTAGGGAGLPRSLHRDEAPPRRQSHQEGHAHDRHNPGAARGPGHPPGPRRERSRKFS